MTEPTDAAGARPEPVGGPSAIPATPATSAPPAPARPTTAAPSPPSRIAPTTLWLSEYPDAVVRHVETLELETPTSGYRRLTIDLTLPDSPTREPATWLLPLARLGKNPPTAFIDLRDEAGVSIPLPTRLENAEITRRVLLGLFPELDTEEHRPVLHESLTALVFSDPPFSRRGLDLLLQHLQAGGYELSPRLRETLSLLVANSIVWLPITGTPGERRSLKLSYGFNLQRRYVPARKPVRRRVRQGVTLDTAWAKGRIDFRQTARLLRARLAARMGWDAIDLTIDEPQLQDPLSYHLRLRLPPVLVVTEIGFASGLEDPQHVRRSEDNLHLYLSSDRPRASGAVMLKIRVGRRGFLNASAASTFVLAALLWGFFLRAGVVTHDPDVAPGAAVLVVAPAVMVLFVTRPNESALLSALLTGIRTSLGIAAAASTIAAAAIAGVRPTSHARPTLAICAIFATLASLSIQIAWLGSFPLVRKHGNRVRAFWCGRPGRRRKWSLLACWLSCAALATWGALAWTNALGAGRHTLSAAAGLIVVVVLGLGTVKPSRPGSLPPGIVLLIGAAYTAAVFLAGASLLSAPTPLPSGWRLGALIAGGTLTLLATIAAVSAELTPMRP